MLCFQNNKQFLHEICAHCCFFYLLTCLITDITNVWTHMVCTNIYSINRVIMTQWTKHKKIQRKKALNMFGQSKCNSKQTQHDMWAMSINIHLHNCQSINKLNYVFVFGYLNAGNKTVTLTYCSARTHENCVRAH